MKRPLFIKILAQISQGKKTQIVHNKTERQYNKLIYIQTSDNESFEWNDFINNNFANKLSFNNTYVDRFSGFDIEKPESNIAHQKYRIWMGFWVQKFWSVSIKSRWISVICLRSKLTVVDV